MSNELTNANCRLDKSRTTSILLSVISVSALAAAIWLLAGIWGDSHISSSGNMKLSAAAATTAKAPRSDRPAAATFLKYVDRLRPRRNAQSATEITSQPSKREPFRINAPGAVKGELILRLTDRSAFLALLAAKLPDGVRILDSVDRWNVLRISVANDSQLDEFLKLAPAADISLNYPVRTPIPATDLPRNERGGYIGFGDLSPAWLGAEEDRAGWGKGVTVAILDGGVNANWPNISHLDMLSSGAYGTGHGTAVASLIAGSGPDVMGIAPACTILSIRVLDADGSGDCFTVAKGILAAVDGGADIINLCLGTSSDSPALRDAVEYAVENGVAVVAAAGNDGIEGVSYPARYDGVVAVSAVDAAGQHLYFSNRGPEIDIAAPGFGVNTTWADSQLVSFSGTSASTPFVSGALAFLLADNPALSAQEAATLLISLSDDAGYPGQDEEFGAGVLDIGRISSRNTSGISDAAVADHYIPYGIPADAATVPLVISVQNRGTLEISSAELNVNISGQQQVLSVPHLNAGETIGYRFDLAHNAAGTGISVSSRVALLNAVDANPANDSRSTTIFISTNAVP